MSTELDREVMRTLMGQVAAATPKNGSEINVETIISRPMWDRWCRAVGIPVGSEPSKEWSMNCRRVYGSKTVVVESDQEFSASRSTI